jgi:hypothetical protein
VRFSQTFVCRMAHRGGTHGSQGLEAHVLVGGAEAGYDHDDADEKHERSRRGQAVPVVPAGGQRRGGGPASCGVSGPNGWWRSPTCSSPSSSTCRGMVSQLVNLANRSHMAGHDGSQGSYAVPLRTATELPRGHPAPACVHAFSFTVSSMKVATRARFACVVLSDAA